MLALGAIARRSWIFRPDATVRRAIISVACAALLLSGQQIATTHQVWHLVQDASQPHAPVQSDGKDHRPASPQKELCGLHAVLGAVVGVMGCDGAAVALAEGGAVKVATIDGSAPLAYPVTATSRDPPSLL